MYSIHSGSTSTASILSKACKLVVAVGRKVKTYQFIPKNPARVPGMGTGGSFVQLHEYPCADNIESVTLGEPTSGKSGQLVCCALVSGGFALVNIETGEEIPLTLDNSALEVQPVMSLQVDDPIDSAMQEFIICYNQAVEFKHPNGHNSRQYNVKWSSRPHAVAYVYPYLLGFTNNAIEVVTMINGSLVKTLSMSRCHFLGCKRGVYFTSTLNGQSMLYKMSEDALSGKASVEDEMGSLQRQVAPGNIFVRRLSATSGLRGHGPNGSPRGGTPKGSPKGSPSSSLTRPLPGSPARRKSSGLAEEMSVLGRKENEMYLP